MLESIVMTVALIGLTAMLVGVIVLVILLFAGIIPDLIKELKQ